MIKKIINWFKPDLQNETLLKNLEDYDKKKKAKQQKPKVSIKRTAGRKRRIKTSINV